MPVDRYDGVIDITLSKHGKDQKPKRLRIETTPALRAAMLRAQAVRGVEISPWIFCDTKGGCYMRDDGDKANTAPAFKTRWQRFQKRLIRKTKITETFKDTDLRSYAADEFESETDAQALLGHSSPETVQWTPW